MLRRTCGTISAWAYGAYFRRALSQGLNFPWMVAMMTGGLEADGVATCLWLQNPGSGGDLLASPSGEPNASFRAVMSSHSNAVTRYATA
ncbi:MAG: hypothetical protein JWN52_3623 [Actinomycetia bacterium]|nr:hypothetical protein [Actinomycetes bacterium]